MTLKIYNNLTRKKEVFEPVTPGKVRMYVCGVTVYDECHLGHARAAIVFDVVYRYFKYLGFDVTYVRNFTDVDDKIIKKSNETGTSWQDITGRYIQSYQEQMKRLFVLAPDIEPKATDHIQEMIGLIQDLITNHFAYAAGNDVFFRVRNFQDYGKLSHKKIDDLESGARIEVDEKKEDPLDFALWKGAKPGEPFWESPWGQGRPGWHIECSAMSMKYLGEQFDIHGGGRDLMFPHHENEIAQSEGATGKQPFARYWIHNGFVNINAEKMSKSLGNFKSIPQILEQYDPEVVRYFLISAHYASPLDFTEQAMTNAREALMRFYETLNRLLASPEGNDALPMPDFDKAVREALDDDFNAVPLVGFVFQHIRDLNKSLDDGKKFSAVFKQSCGKGLQKISDVLGVFGSQPSEFLERQKNLGLKTSSITGAEIQDLIAQRKTARLKKDFKRADEVRQELASKGVVLKDNPDGTTTWEIKSPK